MMIGLISRRGYVVLSMLREEDRNVAIVRASSLELDISFQLELFILSEYFMNFRGRLDHSVRGKDRRLFYFEFLVSRFIIVIDNVIRSLNFLEFKKSTVECLHSHVVVLTRLRNTGVKLAIMISDMANGEVPYSPKSVYDCFTDIGRELNEFLVREGYSFDGERYIIYDSISNLYFCRYGEGLPAVRYNGCPYFVKSNCKAAYFPKCNYATAILSELNLYDTKIQNLVVRPIELMYCRVNGREITTVRYLQAEYKRFVLE